MAFTFDFYQNGGTLLSIIDGVNFGLQHWRPGLKEVKNGLVEDDCEIEIYASSNDVLAQKLALLNQVLVEASNNLDRMKDGDPYTPIFLRMDLPTGSYVLQSEMFGSPLENLDQLLETPVLGSVVEGIKFKILRRAYFEDTALTQLINAQSISNDLEQVSLAAQNCDEASPLYIRVTPGTVDQDDQIIAALITQEAVTQVLAQHVFRLEADNSGAVGYTVTLGSGTAAYTQATFSNGKGAEITPANTNEAMRVRWELDGSSSKALLDQTRKSHVWLRCYEQSGSGSGYLFRMRMGFKFGSKTSWGPYGADQKSVVAGAATGLVPLIDCGVLQPPDLGGTLTTNFTIVIEIQGQAASASGPNFRIDCAYLLPVFEGGKVGTRRSGYCVATLPDTMDATNLGAIDGNDRVPRAYVADLSNNVRASYVDMTGSPLFLRPNKAAGLYVLTRLSSGSQTHQQSETNVLSVWVRKRFRVVKGV